MKKPIQFGKYYLLERVNVGGMAEVWKAKAFGVEGFERLLAVKRILPNIAEDQEFIQMFIDEAKIAVQLSHANICQIFDLGKVSDSYFIAMEFVHGKDLRVIYDRCKQRPTDGSLTMPVAQACFVVMKVCEGLDYAHNKRDGQGADLHLVHRDISPQNVIISYEGEVKLIDFGIAKAVGKGSKTQQGILKGKFGYMSPEQVRGLPLDRRSDIFAVGIVLYELLTGERLFVGESDFSTLEKVRNVEILPPSTYNRRIPDELERIVLKALAKDVEDRYQNAIDLHDDLQAFMYSAGEFYSRKDLAAWMKKTWSAEIEAETAKLEAHQQFTPEPILLTPTPSPAPAMLAQGRPTFNSMPPPPPPAALGMAAAAGAAAMGGSVPHNGAGSGSGSGSGSGKANGKQTMRGLQGAAALAAVSSAPVEPVPTLTPVPELEASDLDWDDEERETHVYDAPTDAADAIEAEISAPKPLVDDFELSPDGSPVPAKVPPRPTPAPMPIVVPAKPAVQAPLPMAAARHAAPSVGQSAMAAGGSAARAIAGEPEPDDATPMPPPPMVHPSAAAASARGLSQFELPAPADRPPSSAPLPSSSARSLGTMVLPAARSPSPWPVWLGGGAGVVAILLLVVYFFVFATPRTGEVQVTTDPVDNVRITVDSQPVAAAEAAHLKLAPGSYAMSVEREGFKPWHETLDVRAGQVVKRRVELDVLAKAGFTLNSEPQGAEALLDGTRLDGVTPFRADGLAPGAHQLEVRVGSRTWKQTITLEPGKILDVRAVLTEPAASPPPAVAAASTANVEPLPSPPAQAPPLAALPTSSPSRSSSHARDPERAPRTHAPSSSFPSGDEPARGTPHADPVAATEPREPKHALPAPPPDAPAERPARTADRPAPAASASAGEGFLRLGSLPACKVSIDGSDTGKWTPITQMKLAAGSHRVTLTNPTFNIRESFAVDIKAGETETVTKRLQTTKADDASE